MRLTLRTMLAHMDGILEPEDNEDIERKIAASDFASNLMHRVRDVVRRLRLGAPGLGGRGPGLDPNTVAEYLDNALHDNQVADFEKVCLESDMQLAEVAASHQILTLVLGEPVEIDPAARQRMYRLPEEATEAARASEARRREKTAVPDYLREDVAPPRRGRMAAIVVLAGCLFIGILAATGRLDPWLKQAGLPAMRPDVAVGPAAPDTPGDVVPPGDASVPPPAAPSPGSGELSAAPPEEPGPPEVAAPSSAPAETPVHPSEDHNDTRPLADGASDVAPAGSLPQMPSAMDGEATEGPQMSIGPLPAAATPGEPPSPAEGQPRAPSLDLAQPMASLPDVVRDTVPAADPVSRPTLIPDGAPMPTPEGGALPPASALPPAEGAMPAPGAAEPAASLRVPAPMPPASLPGLLPPSSPEGPPPPAEPREQVSLGRLVSDRQLLLQYDPVRESWDRVTMQTAIQPEHPLLALPTYRPVVAFSAGITAQFVGPSQAELHPLNGDRMPSLEIAYGRLMMYTLGQPGSSIRLAVGGRLGALTFAAADSGVAMHVYRSGRLGTDPEGTESPLVADLWVTRGIVTWQTDGGQPVSVSAGSRIALGTAAPEPPESMSDAAPAWVHDDPTSLIDKRASATLVDEVHADRPATLTLREAARAHRQREVRWLAVRCLGHLGQFDPMVAVLDEEDSKTVWFDYIDELRAAMARDPRLAAAVRESLQRHYGADAAKLYRMFWGYSSDDLKAGAAAALVDDLQHDRLAVRLLSFWNLRDITGAGQFYRPELPAAKRQQPVQRWRELLASGAIVRKADDRSADQ